MSGSRLRGLILLFFIGTMVSLGQEFEANVRINSDKVSAHLKSVFTSLEKKLKEFINETSFTTTHFSNYERIKCTFQLNISSAKSNEEFSSELLVQATRPVFHSSYSSPILNYRDKNFTFNYSEYVPLQYNPNMTNDNLTLTIVFYLYYILGLDFDTFSPLGGEVFFKEAQSIASKAQSMGWEEWEAFSKERNRYTLLADYMDEDCKPYRQYLYDYHRKGLDIMEGNVEKGRKIITDGMSVLKDISSSRPLLSTPLFFIENKLDELLNIYSKAPKEERKRVHTFLYDLYPTYSSQLEPLKDKL